MQTVLGPIEPERLGVTMTHEHLLLDLSVVYDEPGTATGKDFFYRPVSMETLGRIRHYAVPNADNYRLFEVPTAIEEVQLYKQYGGNSLVDATSVGLSRDPVGLARISRASGIHVVIGSSYYVYGTHPPEVEGLGEDELAALIVRDVIEGADETGIRAGVIGEIGCSWPLHDMERKVLRASVQAQRKTGAPLLIHPGPEEGAPLEIIEVLAGAGADLSRTIMGHLDRTVVLHETLKSIANAGCYLEWDLFGMEGTFFPAGVPGSNPEIDMPTDAKRMDDIAWTIAEGHGRQVLVAHDMCQKYRLESYGGHGYSYILGNIAPRMRARGFSGAAVDDILINNPRDALTFAQPKG